MADTPTAPAAPVSLPPLPPAWSDVLAAAQKAGADAPTIRAGFQKWSADTLNAVRASNAPTPIRQQVNTFIANQYDQFEQPSYWESIGQAVKSIPSSLGSLAITPGAAIHDAATEAGQAIAGTAGTDVGTPDEQGVIAPTAGRKTAVLAQQVATGYQPLLNRVGQVLAHGARIGDIVNAAGAPDYQAESQRVDQFFNSLDTRIDSGQPLSKAFLTQWGDLVKGSAAKANGESPATYNEPDRDPTNAENLKLIAAYAATKDPVYRNALKAKMTIPGVIKEANAEQENTPVGALPDWARSVVEGAGDPINLAATAATIFPLTAPEGAAAKLTLATLGKAAGEGALKGATVMAPLNVAQTAIQNPNATDAQLEQAGTSGLVAGALMGGVAHAAPVVFKGIKDARINAKLTEMGLTPEQFAQMDKNRQEQAATEAARQNAQEEYKQLQNQHSQQTNEGGPEISPPPPEGFGHPGKKVLIGNVLSQRGAIAPDPVAQRAAQIQDALDASYEHNSPFTPVYADEAATEARMAKAFQPGPEYTPDAHTTTKLEALIPRAVQAGLMNLAENDYRTPLQLAIDSQHTMGTKDAAAAAQVLENHLAQEDRIRQSPQGSVLLRQQLQAQSEGLGPEATPPQPQAINIAAPSPEQAISEGKAATGGGKAGAAAGLNIAAPQPSSPINIAAVVNDPTIHIADIATHPALDKIPVEQKANLQVAAALSPARMEGISQSSISEPQPTGEQPNATKTGKIPNDNPVQPEGTSPRPEVPAHESQVRPGNGESPSSGGGSEPSAKGKVAKVPRAKTPYGRRGSVIIPDFLEEGTKRIGNAIARGDTVDKISAEKDAANQQADIEARKQANDIRGALSRALPGFYTKGKVLSRELLSRKVILPEDATTLLQETESGNIGPRLNKTEALGALDRQAATIRASTKADPAQAKRALDAIQFAKDNYDKLAPIVQLADSKYDQQHQIENRFGLQSPYRKGYVFHAQDIENPEGFDSSGGGSGPNSRFRLGRTHDTYADSIANGVKYHTLSAPDLLESRIRNGSKIINNTAWVDALRNINDPINKAPLTAPIQIVSRVNGPDYETVPRGYTKVDLLGRRVGIQDPYVKLVQALSSPSAFENEQLGRLLREGSQLKKSVMTTLDSYHLGWGAWRAITAKLGSLDNPIPTVRSLKGRLALDFSPEEAQRLAAAGQIPKAWLDNIAERSRISQVLVKNGLLPGRGTDALHQELTQRLPILGSANRYIFDGFIRSAINEIGTREFQVQRKMFQNLSEDQLARKVSGEVNNFMGNVGSRGIFKSKTFQDLARIATLAPGLTEGKLRSEIGAPIQALQTIPQSIRAGRPAAGLYARGTAAALIASFTAAQVLNLYFRGYPTWQNKEEGHDAKVSGYIPDAVGGGPGLFYDPLEAAAPTIAQLHDIYARTGDVGKTAVQFARDKSGPLVSPLFDLSGIGPTGKPLKSGVTSAALGYIPAPIAGHVAYDAAKQLITGKHAETYPGEFERQGLSSLGIRTTSVPAPEQRISQLVQNFKKANNIPTFTPGGEDDNPYMALTSALRVNNQSDAKQALADILQKKTLEQVQNYFVNYPLHTLTGSEKNDEKFKATLNPEQVKALDAATASRTKLAQSALQLLSQQPGAGKEMFNLAADAMQKHQESQALNSIATKILANPTGDTARAAINDDIKNGTVPTVNGQPDPGFIKRLDTAYAAMVKAKNEDAQIKDIAKLGASSTDAARAKEIYRIITQDLHTPEDRAKFGQQLMAAKLLTPIVKQQLNLLAQREQQQPQAVGQ